MGEGAEMVVWARRPLRGGGPWGAASTRRGLASSEDTLADSVLETTTWGMAWANFLCTIVSSVLTPLISD